LIKNRFKNKREKALDGERTCLLTGTPLPKEKMIRFVIAPDGTLCPDIAEKLGGRGVWLTAHAHLISEALASKIWHRGFKKTPIIPEGFIENLGKLLKDRCLHLLGLSNRAGFVVAGFEKIKEALAKDDIFALIQAENGSPAEEKRLQSLTDGIPVLKILTTEELGQVLGRDVCVHMALKKSKLTQSVWDELCRLNDFFEKE